jgi:dipicolinate synthase subunit A
MSNEKITILNAIATAEGTIMEAILNSDRNLHRSKCLVLGYGRCAKVLAQKLKALDANVTVAARSKEALAYANSFGLNIIALSDLDKILPDCDYIFNTIPALILTKEKLNLIKQDSTIIDIASYPGGVDFDYAKKLNLTAKLCPALPGKVASKSSADILATEIIGYLKERSD